MSVTEQVLLSVVVIECLELSGSPILFLIGDKQAREMIRRRARAVRVSFCSFGRLGERLCDKLRCLSGELKLHSSRHMVYAISADGTKT